MKTHETTLVVAGANLLAYASEFHSFGGAAVGGDSGCLISGSSAFTETVSNFTDLSAIGAVSMITSSSISSNFQGPGWFESCVGNYDGNGVITCP